MAGPVSIFVGIGEDSVYHLYMEPNQDLKLKIEEGKVTFEGGPGLVNQYLYELSIVTKRVMALANSMAGRFRKFSSEEQDAVVESFSSHYRPLHQAIAEDDRIPAGIKEYLTEDNHFLVQWRVAGLRGTDWNKIEKESSYDAPLFFKNIPVRASYLKANMDTYRRIIDYEIAANLQGSVYLSLKRDGKEKNEDTLALISDQIIRRHTPTAPIRECQGMVDHFNMRPSSTSDAAGGDWR